MPPFWLRLDARRTGALLCAAGLALLCVPMLVTTALALELLAAAFWVWARAASDAGEQVRRWNWVRRPAMAMWVAVAAALVQPSTEMIARFQPTTTLAALEWTRSLAVLWAGLELLAALPLARPFSDLPGPFLPIRPWLPILLPGAGFVVLWQHAEYWSRIPRVATIAIALLILTAVLAALRAFARRTWQASLRWLAVADSALAAALIAASGLPPAATLVLWLGTFGGHAFLLSGELHGATPRRGPLRAGMWRVALAIAVAALSWPTLVALASPVRGRPGLALAAGAAFAVLLIASVSVGRLLTAPERREVVRLDATVSLNHFAVLAVLVAAPLGLAIAWWSGFEPPWGDTLAALAPAAFGTASGLLSLRFAPRDVEAPAPPGLGRGTAARAFTLIVHTEQRIVALGDRLVRVMARPLHELHTGDAQEYLLFLVGLAVLAVVLPLLQ